MNSNHNSIMNHDNAGAHFSAKVSPTNRLMKKGPTPEPHSSKASAIAFGMTGSKFKIP